MQNRPQLNAAKLSYPVGGSMQVVGLPAELPQAIARQIEHDSECAANEIRGDVNHARDDASRAEAEQALESFERAMPLAAITLFYVRHAKESEFAEQGVFLTASTSRLSGVNAFQFHRGAPRPDCVEYMLYEDWNSRELFRAQWESAHLQRFEHAIRSLTVASPKRTFYAGWFGCVGP